MSDIHEVLLLFNATTWHVVLDKCSSSERKVCLPGGKFLRRAMPSAEVKQGLQGVSDSSYPDWPQ
jgi:hypothetical protein